MQNRPIEHTNFEVPEILKLLSGKWKLTILWFLSSSGMKFSELKARIGSISSSVLSAQLKELLDDGFIRKRNRFSRSETDYALTPLGKTLNPLFQAIDTWERPSPQPDDEKDPHHPTEA